MLPASLALAFVALLFRLVSPSEIRALLDLHLLSLFLVLILAVECLKRSGLVEAVVGKVLSRVRSERTLAAAAILTTGAVSAMVTNDVALLLVVPFTLAFEKVAPEFDPIRVVVLEIQAANLLGCLTPTGNPQNLLLFSRGGFTTAGFFAAQLPWVAGMAIATLALVPILVPRRPLPAPPESETARRAEARDGRALPPLAPAPRDLAGDSAARPARRRGSRGRPPRARSPEDRLHAPRRLLGPLRRCRGAAPLGALRDARPGRAPRRDAHRLRPLGRAPLAGRLERPGGDPPRPGGGAGGRRGPLHRAPLRRERRRVRNAHLVPREPDRRRPLPSRPLAPLPVLEALPGGVVRAPGGRARALPRPRLASGPTPSAGLRSGRGGRP